MCFVPTVISLCAVFDGLYMPSSVETLVNFHWAILASPLTNLVEQLIDLLLIRPAYTTFLRVCIPSTVNYSL
jgi:hypothetical protein